VEADEVDFVAAAVFGYFEQVEDAEEAGCAGQVGSDVGEADGLDGIDFDFAFFHGVASADFDAEGLPDADTARDVAASNAIAEAFGEHHGREFTRATFKEKGERSERIAQNPCFRGNYRLSEDRNKRPNRGFVGYHQDWEH
jgi:hypothetical protein